MTRLLIVEDNAEMRRMIRTLVGHLAPAIYECGDGSKAVDQYAACRPDCVLMDVGLPGTDGITATRQITDAFPQARVVIVTDHDSHRLRAAARRAGAVAFVLKENLHELAGLLAHALP